MQFDSQGFPCYLAVGFPLGAEVIPGRNERRAGVRVAGKYISLDLTVFSLWGRTLTPISDGDILHWCREEGVENAREVLGWLQERRLLIRLTGNVPEDVETLKISRCCL